MLFNSAEFAVFFALVTGFYFLVPHRIKWILLLFASCIFYMYFRPVYILILFFTIGIDYLAGILIENAESKRKEALLVLSLVANISVLAFFKYFNFLIDNLAFVTLLAGREFPIKGLEIVLPIGLSFHTFQSMSYTIEVYRGRQSAERNLGMFALYVMFYPQLVAGPIERPQNLLKQFYEKHDFDGHRVVEGLKLMTWGLFKKVVIADRLAVVVNNVYNAPNQFEGLPLIVATFFFAYQIYCDFSGYSDIALGAAHVMGFRLMDNFNSPYTSLSLSEFWRRWHISLSTWFKDYLYVPMGGSRNGFFRWQVNIMVTFLVSGLWHGANWTYVVWGGLHGIFLGIENLLRLGVRRVAGLQWLLRPSIGTTVFRIFYVNALVGFAWIFFRARNLDEALYISQKMFTGLDPSLFLSQVRTMIDGSLGLYPKGWALSFALIIFLEAVQYFQKGRRFNEWISTCPAAVRWAFYYGTVCGIFYFGVFNDSKFIYFQF